MTPEENDLLCRIEGDAPMGRIMRRHWIAACLSEEVAEPDGAPVKVRLLGEDLVVFRDSRGRLGVLDEYCSHRRASLVFARNEDCGLRCLYHGWKFDVDGNIVEMASEPQASAIPERVKHKAYPAHEAGGFVWTYLGPPAEMREFEPPAFAPTSDVRVSATKVRVRCNWAQVLEGQIDSAHSSTLHSSDMVPAPVDGAKATEVNWLRPSTDKAPRFQIERTSYGFRYAAIRRPIMNEATHDYIRTTVYIAPFTALRPVTAIDRRAHFGREVLSVDDVLHPDRHAEKRLVPSCRAGCIERSRLAQRQVRVEIDPGMDLMLAGLDAREAVAHDRFAGCLPGRERAGDFGRSEVVERYPGLRARFGVDSAGHNVRLSSCRRARLSDRRCARTKLPR